jgi:hypothetical protein
VKNETFSVDSELLLKEGSIKPEFTFPEHITKEDLQLYIEFQSTGYFQPSSLQTTVQLVLVADFLSQSSLCAILLSEIIAPQLNPLNFKKIMQKFQFLSSESLSIFLEISEVFTNFNIQEYLSFSQSFSQNLLKKAILETSEKSILLDLFLQKSKEKTFLGLLENELRGLESSKLTPDLEFLTKADLKNLSNQSQVHNFNFRELEMKLLIENSENFDEGVKLVLFSDSETGPAIQGQVVFQGESRSFCYVRGTRSTICRTSQKTRTSSLKLLLKNQDFLTILLPKAASEALEGGSLSNLSPDTISLVSSYLKNKVDAEKIVEVIADWHQSNPSLSVFEVFASTDWTSEDEDFWMRISKNYPFLLKDSQILSLFNIFTPQDEELLKEPDGVCESPSETPFNLDISEIYSPKSNYKMQVKKTLCSRSFQMSASEFESTLKYSQIQNKFFSPNKQKTGRLGSLEEILKLKKKLMNYRAQYKSFNCFRSLD